VALVKKKKKKRPQVAAVPPPPWFAALKGINKDFKIATDGSSLAVPCWPTGHQSLDDLLTGEADKHNDTIPGTGRGFPKGRAIEVFGKESAGKTTFTLVLIAALQKQQVPCIYIDAEHTFDQKYAKTLGVDCDTLGFLQADTAEKVFDDIVKICKDKALRGALIVVDSVAALIPAAAQERSAEKNSVAEQARLLSVGIRRISGPAAKADVSIVFINQTRTKIGVMFGNPNTTPGGSALKFYASLRLEVTRMKAIKKRGKDVGITSRIKAVKNKVASPFREVLCDLYPSTGKIEFHTDPLFGKKSQKAETPNDED
jgi:protein RecA